METNVLNWAYWLEGVCFCTGIIFRTSSLREASRKKINDLRFLDGQGEEIYLFQGLDLHVLGSAGQWQRSTLCPWPCLWEPWRLILGSSLTPALAVTAAWPLIAGPLGLLGPLEPEAALASSTIWCFLREGHTDSLFYMFVKFHLQHLSN